jgi:hypothetical protein
MIGGGLDLSGLGKGSLAGSCEHGLHKMLEISWECQSNCRLLKTSDPWSYSVGWLVG